MQTAVRRTLALVELVAVSGGVTPNELAAKTGLPVSTVYRYISLLVEQEFARKEASLILPGRRLHAIQGGPDNHNEFASLVQEEMEALERDSELTVFLCVRDGAHAVAIKVVQSTQRLKLAMSAGDTLPLYASAPAKLLLALADEAFRETYLATVDIRRLASNTIADRTALRAEIERIRAQGYARSASEADEMASAIAFPVVDQEGQAVMSLAVSGPAQKLDGDEAERLIQLTRRYATAMSASYARYQRAHQRPRNTGAGRADDSA